MADHPGTLASSATPPEPSSSPRVPLIPVLRSSPRSATQSPLVTSVPEHGLLTPRLSDDHVSTHSDPSPRQHPHAHDLANRRRGGSLSVEIPRRSDDDGEHVYQTSTETTTRLKSPGGARKMKLTMDRPKRALSRGITSLFKRHSPESSTASGRDVSEAMSDCSDERSSNSVRFIVSSGQLSSRKSSETSETPPASPLPASSTHCWVLHEGALQSFALTATLTVADVADALSLTGDYDVRDSHAATLNSDTLIASLTPPLCVVCPRDDLGSMWVAPTSPPSLFSRTVRERTDEELAALVAVVKEHAVQQKRSHGMQRRQSKKNAVPERREVQRQADHKGLYLNIAKTWVNMPDHKLRIVTSADGVTRMQAGHVPALIDILVHPTGVDRDYQLNFLMTYNALCTPDTLLAELKRHFAQPREPATATRSHVLDFLKLWLNKRPWDFASDEALEAALVPWLRELPQDAADPLLVRSLLLLAEAQLRGSRKEYRRTMEAALASEDVAAAPPLYPRVSSARVPDVLDFAPGEVARQMCVRDAQGMKAVDVKEWMRAAWGKTHGHAVAPNLDAFIDAFNVRSRWVATTVVCGHRVAERAAAMRFWLSVASECLLLRNFHAALAVVAGLTNSAVERLLQTRHTLPGSALRSLAALRERMSVAHNYRHLRELEAQAAVSGEAAVPYVGIAMGDLTAIEDGNPDTTGDSLVNWEKHEMVARVVLAFEAFKARRYILRAEPVLLALLAQVRVLSDDELFERSLAAESREANISLRARLGE